MIRDSGQHVPQIIFGIDSVQFCCTEQTVNRRGTFSTSIGARKKEILSAQRHNPQRSLCRIIIDFDAPVITEAQQRFPVRVCNERLYSLRKNSLLGRPGP
jgi:hypothetical protein